MTAVERSVWQGTATLVPETSIGEPAGPDEYLFGGISSFAVDDDRTVYAILAGGLVAGSAYPV